MSWLCGGSGVSKTNTIDAGHRALAQHQWARSKKLFDSAWKRDPYSHQVIIDTCERAITRATLKYQALGHAPTAISLETTPGVEPDKYAVEKFKKQVAASKVKHAVRQKDSVTKLVALHGLAKHYHKRLIDGLEDPASVGQVCTNIALHHRALCSMSPNGYAPKHNQRAFDYFSRAIEAYEQAHLPQSGPITGRMDVVTDRLLHTREHWYQRHQDRDLQDASALLLDDFVKLIQVPTNDEERGHHLDRLALLLGRDLPKDSREFMRHEVMAPLSLWLTEPSKEAAALRAPVLRVFEQIIHHQSWAKHDAGDALHAFVAQGNLDLTLEHMETLYPCYRGLIDSKSPERGHYNILPDLDIIRRRMSNNDKALIQVLVLLDDVVRFGSSHHTVEAADMVRTLGIDSPADNVQYSALIILDHLASYNDNPEHAPLVLSAMADLIGTMKNPRLRDYGIVRIAFHNAHPDRMEAAERALYTTLGLQKRTVDQLLSRQEQIYDSISAIEASSTTVAI